MEVVDTRTSYVDEVRRHACYLFHDDWTLKSWIQEREGETDKPTVLFGMTLGATAEDKGALEHGVGSRKVPPTKRVGAIHHDLRHIY